MIESKNVSLILMSFLTSITDGVKSRATSGNQALFNTVDTCINQISYKSLYILDKIYLQSDKFVT